LPDPMSTRLALKRSLSISPELDIVVRASKPKDIEALYQLGAREVVQPELEASLELAAHLWNGLGVSLSSSQRRIQAIRQSRYSEMLPDRSLSQMARDVKSVVGELNNRWYALPDESPILGMTIEETDLRRLTGVAVMAIRRVGDQEIDYPDDSESLEQGDRLLLVGEDAEIEAFEELAKGEAAVPSPESSCQWLRVMSESGIVGLTIEGLDFVKNDRVQVQAIRRDGRFLRLPEGSVMVEAGDRMLVCGSVEALGIVRDRV
jgi:monovalent cation:H+ antiporter-2, CPA2 family